MSPPEKEPSLDAQEKSVEYHEQLDAILRRELTPEDINTYADQALQDLITLVENAIDSYSSMFYIPFANKRGIEESAFRHYELGDIETNLDYIAEKSIELHEIDDIITTADYVEKVILPPSESDMSWTQGSGTFEIQPQVQRLKTVLFVLANDFGIDIHDPTQLPPLQKGTLDPDMMRKTSYYEVSVPSLNRIILVCDEKKNATFVFDTVRLEEMGIPCNQLIDMQKEQLEELLKQSNKSGSRLIYSDNFVNRLIKAIKKPEYKHIELDEATKERRSSTYLIPLADPTDRSIQGLVKDLGSSHKTIYKAIEERKNDLVLPFPKKKFGSRSAWADSLETHNQAVIEDYLRENNFFAPSPPDGVIPMFKFVNEGTEHKVSPATIRKTTTIMIEEGTIKPKTFHFRTNNVYGYTPDERKAVIDRIKSERTQPVSLNHRSNRTLALFLGCDHKHLTNKAGIISESLGEVKTERHRSMDVPSYNPTQQLVIALYMQEHTKSKINPDAVDELRKQSAEYEAERSKSVI